ncbi:MAG TPA: hypothetical protein VGG20_04490 [Thermoanaerobaculia bacterium]|jgi:hypothetical protein
MRLDSGAFLIAAVVIADSTVLGTAGAVVSTDLTVLRLPRRW